MISGKIGEAGRPLERLWTAGTQSGLSDAQLLSRFVDAGGGNQASEAAFRELLDRHAAMVLGVCRQILRHRHDADDAFQATFLILVRKASSIRVDESLAPWLYGVAYRTAHRARTIAARYRPANVESLEEPAECAPSDPYQLDLRPLLHEELNRLPGKFRDPIVLCHLEGKSHEEAARLLRWPVGTVSSRLSRGRRLLRSKLERRGLAVAPAAFAACWLAGTPASATPALIESTAAMAIGSATVPAVSASVLSLTQGVLKIMWLRKLRTISLALLLIGTSTGGIAVWAHWPADGAKQADHRSAPAQSGPSARDNGSNSQPSATPQPLGSDARLADCPADCSSGDGPPAYCPISMAANAFSRMMNHFHHGSESSH